MIRSNNLNRSLIKKHYHRVIFSILRDNKIVSVSMRKPDYAVRPNIGFKEAAHYTGRHDRPSHYRYNRYMEALRRHVKLGPDMQRVAHVDIGCGAGPFSWAFLDWATNNEIGYDHVDLYGYDHSTAMIELAALVRMRLMQTTPMSNYPSLHYDVNIQDFLRRLKMAWHPNTNYIVTFGHVLAQSYTNSPSSIERDFVRIIENIIRLKGVGARCEIVAVDAKGWSRDFAGGWFWLLKHLAQSYPNLSISRSGNPETSMHAVLTEKHVSYSHDEGPLDYDYPYLPEDYDIYNDIDFPDWRIDLPWDDEELPWKSKLPRKQTDDLLW